MVVNMLTIDVEEHFHASVFERTISRNVGPTREPCAPTRSPARLSTAPAFVPRSLFSDGLSATPRCPAHCRRRSRDRVARLRARADLTTTVRKLRNDLRRAKRAIEAAAGVPVLATARRVFGDGSFWAPISSSRRATNTTPASSPFITTVRHRGIASSRHDPQPRLVRSFPGSTVRLAGVNLPFAGGGYFRLLPYAWTKWGIDRVNRREGQPVVFYLHPWEIDQHQPRFTLPKLQQLRHYGNLSSTEARLQQLLADFQFDAISAVSQIVRPAAA
jgi:hypothetical protein